VQTVLYPTAKAILRRLTKPVFSKAANLVRFFIIHPVCLPCADKRRPIHYSRIQSVAMFVLLVPAKPLVSNTLFCTSEVIGCVYAFVLLCFVFRCSVGNIVSYYVGGQHDGVLLSGSLSIVDIRYAHFSWQINSAAADGEIVSKMLYIIDTFLRFFLRTKFRRALSIDSENWHAKNVGPSEHSKFSPMSITLFQSWTRIGFIHGLDWVDLLEELHGLDWIGSDDR